MSMRKVMKKIFVGTLKMVQKVFLRKKIPGDISVEYLGSISGKNLRGVTGKYLGSISGKNLRGITGEIFEGCFEEDFGENIDHYILFVDNNSQTNILK
jgi:outer membrane lipoprotein SlyB